MARRCHPLNAVRRVTTVAPSNPLNWWSTPATAPLPSVWTTRSGAKTQSMKAVIPPKKNPTLQRSYEEDFYKLRPSSKTLSCTGNAGAASPPDPQKTPPPSSPPSKSSASPSGLKSRHYLSKTLYPHKFSLASAYRCKILVFWHDDPREDR